MNSAVIGNRVVHNFILAGVRIVFSDTFLFLRKNPNLVIDNLIFKFLSHSVTKLNIPTDVYCKGIVYQLQFTKNNND